MSVEKILEKLNDIRDSSTENHIKTELTNLINSLKSADVLPEGPSEEEILNKLKQIENEVGL